MRKEHVKALSQIGIFPGDIITARPDNMSYEAYKEARRKNQAKLKSYLASGKTIHVSSLNKPVYDKDGTQIGSIRKTNPMPYINTKKFTDRVERHQRDKRFVMPTEAKVVAIPQKGDWRIC